MAKETLICSFCGKMQLETNKLIASPNGSAYICDECVKICSEILDSSSTLKMSNLPKLLLPKEIKKVLDDYIIEQDNAKQIISVAVYNHYKRLLHSKDKNKEIEIDKSNVLLIGPTGCGKTLLAKTLARVLNVPFATSDATSLTEAGYVGDDVESILFKLLQNANFDVRRAETGIVYIDEIDKIAKRATNKSLPRDPSGEGVQQGLLKILEGTKINVPLSSTRKYPTSENIEIDTSNILFICGGAFVGIDEVVKDRTNSKNLGFIDKKLSGEQKNQSITPADLTKFGIIPEFIGRLPIIAELKQLTKSDLVKILTQPKNSIIKQYVELFNFDGIELEFTLEAIDMIAEKALALGTGARALRSIMESTLLNVSFEAPSDKSIQKIVISKDKVDSTIIVPQIYKQLSTTLTAHD